MESMATAEVWEKDCKSRTNVSAVIQRGAVRSGKYLEGRDNRIC